VRTSGYTQDPLGIQAFKYTNLDSTEVWVKPLENDEWAVCFLNRKSTPVRVEFDWKQHIFDDPVFSYEVDFSKEKFRLFNIWEGRRAGRTNRPLSAEIGPHDVLMFRLEK